MSLTGQFLDVFDRLGRCFSLLYLGFSPGFIFCTVGQFLWTVFTDFPSGWLAAPLTHLLLGLWFVFSRDAKTGWVEWCRSRVFWGFYAWFLFSCGEQLRVSDFACDATGLDAVQRLEQKKEFLIN